MLRSSSTTTTSTTVVTTMQHLYYIHILKLIFIPSYLLLSINAGIVVQTRDIINITIPSISKKNSNGTYFNSTPPTSPIRILTLAGPSSLHPSDKFFSIAQLQLQSMQLVIDEVNKKRCGVYINGENYMLRLVSYGDESSQVVTEAVARSFLSSSTTDGSRSSNNNTTNNNDDDDDYRITPPVVDAVVSGYSSYLTSSLAPIVQNANKILVAGGAADTSIFTNRDAVFGTFPPTSLYLTDAIRTLTERTTAQSIASVFEDSPFTRGVCSRVPSLAQSFDRSLTVTGMHVVPSSPTMDDFLPVARALAGRDTDVVVTCVYAPGCEPYVRALRAINWNPKAQILTVCVGTKRFADEVGDDVAFVMGITPWRSRFRRNEEDEALVEGDEDVERDAVTGWSARDFAARFDTHAGRPATYHAASAAAAVSILIQAWEKAGTTAMKRVEAILREGEFTTSYGRIAFDENGQSLVPPSLIQYDPCSYEVKMASDDELIYPMPSWSWRDCHLVPTCANPEENLNLMDDARLVGSTLLGINSLTSISFFAWTVYNRQSIIVRRSQPIFLHMICLGSLIAGLSIIPISIDDSIVSTNGCNIACMATLWLFYIGFTIMFSALFSKMLRLNQLISRMEHFRVVNVRHKDVGVTCTLLMLANLSILSLWTLKDPLRWKRQPVCGMSSTVTYGHCVFGTNGGIPLHITLSTLNGGLVLMANYQAFKARNIKLEMSESRYISIAMVMIFLDMIICFPLLRLLNKNTKLKYIMTTGLIFLLCMSISCLVFIPKCHNLRKYTKAQQDNQNINQDLAIVGDGLRVEWESSSMYQHSNNASNIQNSNRWSGNGATFDPVIRERKQREFERKLKEQGIDSAVVFRIYQDVNSIDIE